jgi:hypothetical protein
MKIRRRIKKGTKIGDKKEKVKFAFFPVRIDELTSVWLEKYIEVFEAQTILKPFPTGIGPYGIWMGVKYEWVLDWVSIKKRCYEKI